MLGHRTAVKEDIGLSPCNILYGCSLQLPADLIIPHAHSEALDVNSYADQLRMIMRDITPAQSRPITKQNSQIDPRLETATHVFVHNETKRGLENNYKGPYKVLEKHEKYFKVQLDKREDNITVNRLKAAILSADFENHNIDKPKPTVIQVRNQTDSSSRQEQPVGENHLIDQETSPTPIQDLENLPNPTEESSSSNQSSELSAPEQRLDYDSTCSENSERFITPPSSPTNPPVSSRPVKARKKNLKVQFNIEPLVFGEEPRKTRSGRSVRPPQRFT